MCVIFYQTSSQPLFTYDEIKAAALTNPHGMGWMANINGIVEYQKGYFNVDKFYDDYVQLRNNPDLVDIALHFRIGTGSAVDIANCHPFPLTSNKKRIKKSSGHCDVGIMMNGIIGKSTTEFSDTALYVMNSLKGYYDIDRRFFLHLNRHQLALFENEILPCRFVFMCKDGTKLFGSGWSNYENKGQVSNRHWIPKPVYKNKYHTDDVYIGSYDGFDEWYESKRAKRFANKKKEERHKSYIDYLMEATKEGA